MVIETTHLEKISQEVRTRLDCRETKVVVPVNMRIIASGNRRTHIVCCGKQGESVRWMTAGNTTG